MTRDPKIPETRDLVDESYLHVRTPRRIVEAGRPDIDGDDRPGRKFVAAVRDFAADGGFDRMREDRTAPVEASKLTIGGPVSTTGIRESSSGSEVGLEAGSEGNDD